MYWRTPRSVAFAWAQWPAMAGSVNLRGFGVAAAPTPPRTPNRGLLLAPHLREVVGARVREGPRVAVALGRPVRLEVHGLVDAAREELAHRPVRVEEQVLVADQRPTCRRVTREIKPNEDAASALPRQSR